MGGVTDSIPEILFRLRFDGFECYSSWCGRADGPYIVARNKLWSKSNPGVCLRFLVPIDDSPVTLQKCINYIEQALKKDIGDLLKGGEDK